MIIIMCKISQRHFGALQELIFTTVKHPMSSGFMAAAGNETH